MTKSLRGFAFSSLAAIAILLSAGHALGQEADRPPNAAERVTARDSLPFRTGQWGAEFLIDDGTAGVGVLYFRTPRRAWLLDFALAATWYEAKSSFSPDVTGGRVFVRARAGPRRYRPIASRAAAHLGYGLTAAFGWAGEGEDDARSRTWDAGVFGELGGAYFLTSHFSLGAQGGLYATYAASHYRASQPPIATRDRSLNVQVRPVRIVGGLYF